MTFESKFNVGEKVYIITWLRSDGKDPCLCCKKGKIVLKGEEFVCPACAGLEYREYDMAEKKIIGPFEIDYICFRKEGHDYHLDSGGLGKVAEENQVFKTKKEALKELKNWDVKTIDKWPFFELFRLTN